MIALKPSVIRPGRLVEIAFSPFVQQFAERDISVDILIPHTLPEIECDAAKIAWVLTNFLSNAIRYTPQWGKLTIRGSMIDQKLRVSIENSGYGVPLERLAQMFDRSEDHTARDFGQGLALNLSREIVEAHGGTIGAESELGQMTRFYIDLPAAA